MTKRIVQRLLPLDRYYLIIIRAQTYLQNRMKSKIIKLQLQLSKTCEFRIRKDVDGEEIGH